MFNQRKLPTLACGISAAVCFLAAGAAWADLTVAPDFPVAGRPAAEQTDVVNKVISAYARDVKVAEPVPEAPAKKVTSDAEVARER